MFDKFKNIIKVHKRDQFIKIKNENDEDAYIDLSDLLNKNNAISNNKLNSSTYYSCMSIRCNSLAKLPINLYCRENGGRKKAEDHPLHNLLKLRPNKNQSLHDFLWLTEFYRLEYGNAYWYQEVKNGTIIGLHLLHPNKIQIVVDDGNILGSYDDIMNDKIYYYYNNEIFYDEKEIVHFKNFATNPLIGTPIKQYLKQTIEVEQYSTNFINKQYEKGLLNPIIIKYTADFNNVERDQIMNKFSKFSGVKNVGKVIPLMPGFDINQIKTSLVDNQFFEMQGLTSKHIANAFGVKGFQLNDMEKSTYSNLTEQNKIFYRDTLQNVLTLYEQEMAYKLLTKAELENNKYYFKFNIDSILRTTFKERMEGYEIAFKNGFMPIKEIREKEDLPYIDGTDSLIIGNGASIPLSMVGKQYVKGGENNE